MVSSDQSQLNQGCTCRCYFLLSNTERLYSGYESVLNNAYVVVENLLGWLSVSQKGAHRYHCASGFRPAGRKHPYSVSADATWMTAGASQPQDKDEDEGEQCLPLCSATASCLKQVDIHMHIHVNPFWMPINITLWKNL